MARIVRSAAFRPSMIVVNQQQGEFVSYVIVQFLCGDTLYALPFSRAKARTTYAQRTLPLRGQLSKFFLKNFGEVGEVIISDLKSNFGDCPGTLLQQLAGAL